MENFIRRLSRQSSGSSAGPSNQESEFRNTRQKGQVNKFTLGIK